MRLDNASALTDKRTQTSISRFTYLLLLAWLSLTMFLNTGVRFMSQSRPRLVAVRVPFSISCLIRRTETLASVAASLVVKTLPNLSELWRHILPQGEA